MFHHTDELRFMMSLVSIFRVHLFRYTNQPATTETFCNAISTGCKCVFENIDINHMNENLANEMHKMYIHISTKEHGQMMTLTGTTLDDKNL